MQLAPGARLGPYEILAPIGAGGMGEVYKARDTRLDRTVAIKVSKEAFSERFEREARVAGSLNHPNLCQLYDVGPDYLVMEFIDGAPLESVDSTRKLLDIAVQIADGMAAAHAAGIVHRDLKPDNIFLTRDGRVKILDFGLAKAVATAALGGDATRTVTVTGAGTTIGTIAYMSPEQARGAADLRPQSDQFSFGLVLYELATGHRPFPRDSAAEIMTAIIREDAEPLPSTVPAPLRWIIERLLAKDPADRYDSTRDLYRELRQVRDRMSESSTAIQAATTAPVPQPGSRIRKRAIFTGLAAVLAAGAIGWLIAPSGGPDKFRFTPMEVSWESPSSAIWSPDGSAFTYVAGPSADRHIFVRYLNSPTPVILTHGSNDWLVAGWSPDGKRVIARGANPDGKTRYALFSVPVFGGDPVLIMPLDVLRVVPRVSQDGKALAAIGFDDQNKMSVYTASPVGSPLQRYTPAPFETSTTFNAPFAAFAPDGTWITLVVDAAGGRQMWKLPYPPGKAQPERIVPGLTTLSATPRWSWFPDGRNGIVSSSDEHSEDLWYAGVRSGLKRKLMGRTISSSENAPALSPDGKRLLFSQSRADYHLVSVSLADATATRLLSSEVLTGMPSWALHQPQFVYVSDRSGAPAIWMRGDGWDRAIVTPQGFPVGATYTFATPELSPGADRLVYTWIGLHGRFMNWISSVTGGPPVRMTNAVDAVERGGSWSPDGSSIAYWEYSNGTASLMIVKSTGEAAPVALHRSIGEMLPSWSPDGRWITYRDAPERGGLTLISPDGKTVRSFGEPDTIQVAFSPDSKRLYGIRVEPDRCALYSLDIATKEQKTIGYISRDFTPSSYSNPGIRLSVAPDGKSILYPMWRRSNSLWMLEGFDQPTWLDKLRQ